MSDTNESMETRTVSLPPCRCGAAQWTEGGGSLSSEMCQRGYRCRVCGRDAMAVYVTGGNAFLVGAVAGDMAAESAYLNATMMTVWRDRAARMDVPRAAHERRFREAVNVGLGLPPETRGHEVPEAQAEQWHLRMRACQDGAAWRTPPGFERLPELARIPEGMWGWVRQPTGWERADAAKNRDIEIPSDPIRVAHDAKFAAIFGAVRTATGAVFEPRETPNLYWRDEQKIEPWYAFKLDGAAFVVGPRKRVISLAVALPAGRDRAALLSLGTRDGTTSWETTTDVGLHAWGNDKAIEYLTAMVRAARGA